jgi:hypothetical protein
MGSLSEDLIDLGTGLTARALHAPHGPARLYHYTTAHGLVGILGGPHVSLWASRVLSLNDVLEVHHGLELARELFAERKGRDRLERRFIEAARQAFPAEPGHVGKIVWDTYVMAFSEEDDLLPQWVHYADRGGGYSVGFDRARLREAVAARAPSYTQLGPVIYDVKKQRRLLALMLDQFLARLARERRLAADELAVATEVFWISITNLCVCFKAPAHRIEREWRLFFFSFLDDEAHDTASDLQKMQFRPIGDRIIPYFVLPLIDPNGHSPVASIRLGPSVDAATASPAARLMLKRVNATEREPRRSQLMLRR